MERLTHLYQSIGTRDLVEIGILALIIYGLLSFLGAHRGGGIVRGLGLVLAGMILLLQVVIISFDLTELSKVLDYLLSATLLGLIVIFQPELRRGLVTLGRYRLLRVFASRPEPIADKLADALAAMSREFTGALIAVQRGMSLSNYIHTGEKIDAAVSAGLLRAIFNKRSPLHDGAVIIHDSRIIAAGCQLPLGDASTGAAHYGMRHRAAIGLSEETDALVLVSSEETGRVSIAQGGKLETVPREVLARKIRSLLPGSLGMAA